MYMIVYVYVYVYMYMYISCIQQRKTTCLISIRKSLACARTSKLTTNMYIARASAILGTGWRVQVFSLLLDSSVGLSAGIQSAKDSVPRTLWVRILHSAEEDNLSPFDSKIACLCQSIEMNNKYVYVHVHICVCVCACACVCVCICTVWRNWISKFLLDNTLIWPVLIERKPFSTIDQVNGGLMVNGFIMIQIPRRGDPAFPCLVISAH